MTRPGVLQLVAEHTSIVCAFAHPKRREQTSAIRIGAVVSVVGAYGKRSGNLTLRSVKFPLRRDLKYLFYFIFELAL